MKQYRGEMSGGDLLLTIHDDESVELAFRPDQWSTWGAPVLLSAVTP